MTEVYRAGFKASTRKRKILLSEVTILRVEIQKLATENEKLQIKNLTLNEEADNLEKNLINISNSSDRLIFKLFKELN